VTARRAGLPGRGVSFNAPVPGGVMISE